MAEPIPINRNNEQNKLLHAVCGDVAKQKKWASQYLDTEGWKRLFVDAWARETGRSPGKVVPSLDGESVVILNISTRKLSKRDFAELMDWIMAYCAVNEIRISAPEAYASYREANQ